MRTCPVFSLVIPVYNEEKLIDELVRRTVPAIESFTADYELIFVDDGSTDRSAELILQHRKKNKKVKLLSLSRNFGHQAAYTAGLEYSAGDIVGMMDGDLQDPPEVLRDMYNKMTAEDLEVVSGIRSGRRGSRRRNLTSGIFHFLFRHTGNLENIENSGNFSIMKRVVLEAVLSMREKVRYIPGLRAAAGFRQGYVEYVRDDRYGGKPKMTFKSLFSLAGDAIFSFSKLPVRICLILGIAGTVIFFGAGIYFLIAKISGAAVPGWLSTFPGLYFLGSIQLLFLGILGEYIYRNYKETQNRPIYFARKFYDEHDENEEDQ
ncbi:MAG: glycosyltransferase family 2 protein [Bacteroidales bacterium]|nr:glycosyltransferase family 2 protein [Bacteroidales bacterium]